MKWEKVKLGDICKYVTSGGTPKSSIKEYYEPKQIPWLKTKEVNYCRIYETESYISKDGLDNSSAKMIPQNSVIVAMYGQGDTAGRVAINKIPLTTNQACCNLIIDETKAYYEFVYYQLVTLYEKMVSLKNGGAQPNLNAAIIKSIEIKLPPLKTQRYIADILSSYDNLIENNQKQIKLLEEAAQRLYKEWFVDLRFPGHENTKIVDGVPEGWRVASIADICDTVGGGTPSTKIQSYYEKGDILWVTPTDITRNFSLALLDTEKKITPEGLKNSSAKMLPAETILMTSRASVGFFGMCKYEVCTNQGFISCIPKRENLQMYLLFNLKSRVEEIRQKAGGSTYLEISKTVFRELKIILPKDEVLAEYQKNVHDIFDEIYCRTEMIKSLVDMRNRLLPKLMSGEVEV